MSPDPDAVIGHVDGTPPQDVTLGRFTKEEITALAEIVGRVRGMSGAELLFVNGVFRRLEAAVLPEMRE